MIARHVHYLNSFFKNLIETVFSKNFLFLTLIGNSFIFFAAFLFYNLEFGINSQIHSFIDALWFSFSTVTTVGYGDVTPQTFKGKVLGIFMMLLGSALFATFTALFANALLGIKFEKFHSDVKKISKVGENFDFDEEQMKILISSMKSLLKQFEKNKK